MEYINQDQLNKFINTYLIDINTLSLSEFCYIIKLHFYPHIDHTLEYLFSTSYKNKILFIPVSTVIKQLNIDIDKFYQNINDINLIETIDYKMQCGNSVYTYNGFIKILKYFNKYDKVKDIDKLNEIIQYYESYKKIKDLSNIIKNDIINNHSKNIENYNNNIKINISKLNDINNKLLNDSKIYKKLTKDINVYNKKNNEIEKSIKKYNYLINAIMIKIENMINIKKYKSQKCLLEIKIEYYNCKINNLKTKKVEIDKSLDVLLCEKNKFIETQKKHYDNRKHIEEIINSETILVNNLVNEKKKIENTL